MPQKIEDTFGEKIGMSRRDIRRFFKNGSGDILEETLSSPEDEKILKKALTRDVLWEAGQWDKENAGTSELYRSVLCAGEYAFIHALPPKCPPLMSIKEYVENVVKTRKLVYAQFSQIIEKEDIKSADWKIGEILKNMWGSDFRTDFLEKIDTLVENAVIAGYPDRPDTDIFTGKIRLSRAKNGKYKASEYPPGGRMWTYQYFNDRESLLEWLDERKKNRQSKKEKKEEPVRPMLAKVTRNGPDYGMRKIMPDDFQETFGFRGGEFGTWLSQKDREQSLAWAHASFLDLAKVLGIAPSDIASKNLAFAFGARGHGGKRAACAHYEPDRNVINLTKINGAGSVAHEWGHYLDYMVLVPKRLGSSSMPWLIWREIAEDDEKEKFLECRRRLQENKSESNLLSWIPLNKRNEWKERLDACSGRKEYAGQLQDIIMQFVAPKNKRNGPRFFRFVEFNVLKKDYSRKETVFLKNAKLLDQGRNKPYWSRADEMFARAFEKYVFDLLASHGYHNDYLVNFYQYEINPYPDDEEMKLFAPHIKQLIRDNFNFVPDQKFMKEPAHKEANPKIARVATEQLRLF